MSLQLYITRLKCLVRNKENMFWSFLFPILLATCFFFAFNNLWSAETFETIPIAYDNEGAAEDPLKDAMKKAKMSEGTPLFSITYTDQEAAKKLLEEDEIKAYIVGSKEPMLYVKKNGINETIVKAFLDSYRQTLNSIETIAANHPESLQQGLIEEITEFESFVYEPKDQKKPDEILIFFYALLAYTCLFAANGGLEEVINIQADQSYRGARVNISPVHKLRLFLINLSAGFTVHCVSILVLFIYMYYVINVKFGENLLLTFLICLLGSLAGIAMGATIGLYVKKKADVKEAILTFVVLGGGFLSGMMITDIKYMISEKLPILGYINPVNLVSDSLYSLYYYETYDRFIFNCLCLGILTILFGILSYLGLRRRSYASI